MNDNPLIDNLAILKNMYQSSEHTGTAVNAVDDSIFAIPDICISTTEEVSPWLLVDTADNYGIIAVAMVTPGDSGEPPVNMTN